MPGPGQPTLYRPEYCEQVIEMGLKGMSVAQMCSSFNITRQTIDNWAAANPEFLEAFMKAKVHMQAHLEAKGYNGLESKDFNASLWKTTMMARFREDYTERREQTNITKQEDALESLK